MAVTLSSCGAGTQAPALTIEFSGPLVTAGVLDGRPEETFGVLVDLAVDATGGMFALDADAHVIHRLSPAGDPLERIGRTGEGPGEFTEPVALWWSAPGELAVADGRQFRVSRFDVSTTPARHLGDERLMPPIQSGSNGCMIGGELFANAPFGTATEGLYGVQVFQAGMPTRVLEPVPTDSALEPAMRERLRSSGAVGRVACHPAEPLLVFAPMWRPVVRVVRPDGEPVADWSLSDYEHFTARRTETGGIAFGPDPRTGQAHQALVATWIGSSRRFLVQYGKVGEGLARDAGPSEYRLFDLTSGATRTVRRALPTFTTIRDGRAYGYVNLPFPQVQVWTVTQP